MKFKEHKTIFQIIAIFVIIIGLIGCNKVKNIDTTTSSKSGDESSLSPYDQIMGDNFPPRFLIKEIFGDRPTGAKKGGDKFFIYRGSYYEIFSEEKQIYAGIEDGSLYIRSKKSTEKNILVPRKNEFVWNAETAKFSPDGNQLAAYRIDNTNVPKILLRPNEVDSLYKPYVRAGQTIPEYQIFLINTSTSNQTQVKRDFQNFPYVHIIEWSPDNNSLYLIQTDRLFKTVQLLEVDSNTGTSKVMLTETSDTYLYDGLNLQPGYTSALLKMKIVYFLNNDQFIWMSERNGFYQLYLYDKSGELVRPLSNHKQNSLISRLVGVDENNEWAYFVAMDNPKNPYKESLFRTSLKEEKIEKIIESANSIVAFELLVEDTIQIINSSVPEYIHRQEVYLTDGTFVEAKWSADMVKAKEIIDSRFIVDWYDAPDGSNKLKSAMIVPNNLDLSKKHPVVEIVYAGAWTKTIPKDFETFPYKHIELLRNGFILVMIDGRGSSSRGKAFRDYSYGRIGQVEMEDHAFVMKELLKKHSYMDANRVGISGASWGGRNTITSLEDYPELYKVGVAAVPNVEVKDSRRWAESFMGCLPQDCPERYETTSILRKISQIKGPLLLGYGSYDDGVPIAEGYKLKTALDKSGISNYVFKEYIGATHRLNKDFEQETIHFFLEHL